jgi:hypothetical protein
MEGSLTYIPTGTAGNKFYNLARDYAAINGKNEEVTTRDGHLYGYIVEVNAYASAAGLLTFTTIPNTWKVRNAFRKFHFSRDMMFDQAGVEQSERGKYGHTMRPYFSSEHRTDGEQPLRIIDIPSSGDAIGRSATGGEWTYTKLASQPTLDETQLAKDLDLALVDKWDIHVLGPSVASDAASSVNTWTSVGMVSAYNVDRMDQIPDADNTEFPGSTIQPNNNPLAALRTQNLGTGEVLDLAQEQEEEKPPYDILSNGDSVDAVIQHVAYMSASGEAATRRLGTMFVPAGLLMVNASAANSNGLNLKIVGKVLCKDMA